MTTVFDDITAADLNHLVANIWRQRDWDTTVSTTPQAGGVDIIAEREAPLPEKQLIQVKHYVDDNPVSESEIQQYADLKHQFGNADNAVLVTSGHFTEPARETAQEANIKLVDGEGLAALARDTGVLETTQDSKMPMREFLLSWTRDDSPPLSARLEELFRVVVILFVLAGLFYAIWGYRMF